MLLLLLFVFYLLLLQEMLDNNSLPITALVYIIPFYKVLKNQREREKIALPDHILPDFSISIKFSGSYFSASIMDMKQIG